MENDGAKQTELPDWVREAIEEGEFTDDVPNKRGESRRVWTLMCSAESRDGPAGYPVTARVFNVASGGVGLITRRRIEPAQRLRLIPEGASEDAAINVRVMHCTQTVQGFKIGCSFESP